MKTKKPIEIEIDKIIGIDDEERDDSVGFYSPFCIIAEQDGQQVQLFLNYDNLIDLMLKLKPYLESYEAQIKADEEMHKAWEEENDRCKRNN